MDKKPFTFKSAALEVSRLIWDEWRTHLSNSDVMILMFIYNRTYRFNKTEEAIPMRHFTEGISSDSYDISGLKESERYIYKRIKYLKDIELVITESKKGGSTRYSLNISLTEKELFANICKVNNNQFNNQLEDNNQFNNQRTRQPLSYRTVPPVLQDSTPCPTGHPHINKHIETSNIKHAAPKIKNFGANTKKRKIFMKKDNLIEIEKKAKEANLKSRTKNKRKCNASGLYKIWYDSMKEFYPEYKPATWTNAQQGSLVKLFKDRLSQYDPMVFIPFVLENWNYILKNHIAYLKHKPKYPDVLFFVKFVHSFIEAYTAYRNPKTSFSESPKDSAIKTKALRLKHRKQKIALQQERDALKQKLARMEQQLRQETAAKHKGKTLTEIANSSDKKSSSTKLNDDEESYTW